MVALHALEPRALADERPNVIVFYTDDHGHADLSCQGVLEDIRTPYVDALAASGARAIHGYSTAPQCVPSRGGLMIGKFQGRFDLDNNGSSLEGFNAETTIAQRLQAAGYVTAHFGKWHLGPTPEIPSHGFRYSFAQNANRPFSANIDLDGNDRPMGQLKNELYHVDGCSKAAASVIERHRDEPFFLYVAYRAPHVPLDAPKKYLDRFPGEMPERRRQALAMLSAVDDGVGLITGTLAKLGLSEKTLIFYIGDNGAPLKIHKDDAPGGGPGWDGSLNDPLNGEKGMLSEGGIHVPFVVTWPGTIPGGQQYPHPLSALDVAATVAAVSGLDVEEGGLDGVNLLPFLTGEEDGPPREALFWRWVAQSAVREGDWKLLRGGEREYLYNLADDVEEKHNLASQEPEIANRLRAKLAAWCEELNPPGLKTGDMSQTWNDYFDFYLEGKPAPPLRKKSERGGEASKLQGWAVRNGTARIEDGGVLIEPAKPGRPPFMARASFEAPGPARVKVQLLSEAGGKLGVAWRLDGQGDFMAESKTTVTVEGQAGWMEAEVPIEVEGKVIHLRLTPPRGAAIRRVEVAPREGRSTVLLRPFE